LRREDEGDHVLALLVHPVTDAGAREGPHLRDVARPALYKVFDGEKVPEAAMFTMTLSMATKLAAL
jgi:hypothetical protein